MSNLLFSKSYDDDDDDKDNDNNNENDWMIMSLKKFLGRAPLPEKSRGSW